MISLEEIRLEGYEPVSLEVGPGKRCAVIASSEHQKNVILKMLTGTRRPDSGRLFLGGMDVYALPEDERIEFYRNVGFVWVHGGMLSNLKVWENILLPAEYHRGVGGGDIEAKVLDMLESLGVIREAAGRFLHSQPFALPAHQRMYAAFVRETMMSPDTIIYDSIFDGLGPSSSRRLGGLTAGFDRDSEGRAALYMAVDEDSIGVIGSDIVIDLRRAHGEH